MKKIENMTDEELQKAIQDTKSVSERLADEERQRGILNFEFLSRLRKQFHV
jgi:hypothetical protein